MTRREKAIEYFKSGCNCSQSVVLAFSDLLDMDEKSLARLSSSFGGGIGRLREVCGAVSGMCIVAGLLYGFEAGETGAEKAAHYARIQALAHEFEAQNGSIICRELMGLSVKHDAPTPEARTKDFYRKRPCTEMVGIAAEILERYVNEQK